MSNEQTIAYLLSIINGLEVAISQTMDHIPENMQLQIGIEGSMFNPLRTTYPLLDPILEYKEHLYEQLEALRGKK
jgi:hypothetical protein